LGYGTVSLLKLKLKSVLYIMMIGSVEEKYGLHYVSRDGTAIQNPPSNKTALAVTSNANTLMWHKCLGHPSFTYLKFLYPHLFINKEQPSIKCEQCVLAKWLHSHYPIQSYKSSKPFHLIHSYI